MPKQALYLKWRPQTFEDVIGQEHITRTLQNSIESGRIRHAYLFSGPRGTGKTTTARLLAAALGAGELDLIEIDAASHTGVDDVRDLRDKIAFMPSAGDYKVYIIDEVHRFSGSAFDALLKTLEEPPPHAVFVLATTEIDKVPDTIKSRCLQFEFRRVALPQVADRLQRIAESEGLNIERAALEMIARHGTGSVRDSISLLDQIVADPEEEITLELAQRILGTASSETVLDLVEAIIGGDTVRALHAVNAAVDSGSDPRQYGQQIVEQLRGVLMAQTASSDLLREVPEETRARYAQQAQHISRQRLIAAIRAFNDAVNDQRSGWQPQLALELAVVDSVSEGDGHAGNTAGPTSAADVTGLEMLIERVLIQKGAQLAAANPQGAAQPVPEPEPVAANPDEPAVVDLEKLRQLWPEVRTALKAGKNLQLAAYLDYAQVDAISGNVVTLGVYNDQSGLFLERLSKPENIKLVEYVLLKIHETPLRVSVVQGGSGQANEAASTALPDDPLLRAMADKGAKIKKLDDK